MKRGKGSGSRTRNRIYKFRLISVDSIAIRCSKESASADVDMFWCIGGGGRPKKGMTK